jgi:hypothetical protein
MRMLKQIMVEWTNVKPGEKHVPHTIDRHIRNAFTSYVELQMTSSTPGINIRRSARFLFEGTNATTLYRAYMALFSIGRDDCPDIHAAWQEIMHRVNEVHINIPLKARGKNEAAFRISTYLMKMIPLSLFYKYLRDDATLQLVQDILDNKQ